MGLDIGDRRIGVALSDPGGIIATPFTIINRASDTQAISEIVDILRQQEVERIIAGIPISLNGGIGQQAARVKDFIDVLSLQTQVPVELRDESLTTQQARQIMLKNRSRKNRQMSKDDAIAAAVLLQDYLDESHR